MRNHQFLIVAAMTLAIAGVSLAAKPIGVTNLDGGTQIWFDVSSYDDIEPHYQPDTTYIPAGDPPLSGAAYYTPDQDDFSTLQPWYMEYQIDPADVPGVSLSGDWYFWARTIQPTYTDANYDPAVHWQNNAGNDSHLLFVKGDPGDGAGATWYTDAISSADNADDRILNQMTDDPSYGADTWIWWSGNNLGDVRSKQFNVVDGVVTWRISERESHEQNARIDVMVWSTVPGFSPDDDTYKFDVLVGGDGNRDTVVDDADYTIWADNYLASPATWDEGDYNWDGTVDDADYTIWADNYLASSLPTPEPATMSLLALGAAAVLRRRK